MAIVGNLKLRQFAFEAAPLGEYLAAFGAGPGGARGLFLESTFKDQINPKRQTEMDLGGPGPPRPAPSRPLARGHWQRGRRRRHASHDGRRRRLGDSETVARACPLGLLGNASPQASLRQRASGSLAASSFFYIEAPISAWNLKEPRRPRVEIYHMP